MGELWKDWTSEQWSNAVFCEICGLPLFEVPFEEQQNSDQEKKVEGGTYQCAFCTWQEDETSIQKGLRAQIHRLEVDNARLAAKLRD